MGHEKWLRLAAIRMHSENRHGWGNTCEAAANHIAGLEESAKPKGLDSLNRAAKELPLDWHIEVHVEQGSGWAELYDDDSRVDFPTKRESIDEEIDDAIDFAILSVKE